MHKCAVNFGRSLRVWESMTEKIKNAGFINVQEKLYKCPSGAWYLFPFHYTHLKILILTQAKTPDLQGRRPRKRRPVQNRIGRIRYVHAH